MSILDNKTKNFFKKEKEYKTESLYSLLKGNFKEFSNNLFKANYYRSRAYKFDHELSKENALNHTKNSIKDFKKYYNIK